MSSREFTTHDWLRIRSDANGLEVTDPHSSEVVLRLPAQVSGLVARLLRIENAVATFTCRRLIRTLDDFSRPESLAPIVRHLREHALPTFCERPERTVAGREIIYTRHEQAEKLLRCLAGLEREAEDPLDPGLLFCQIHHLVRFMISRRILGQAPNCTGFVSGFLFGRILCSRVATLVDFLRASGLRESDSFHSSWIPRWRYAVGIEWIPDGFGKPIMANHAFLASPSISDPDTPVVFQVNGHCGPFSMRLGLPKVSAGARHSYFTRVR